MGDKIKCTVRGSLHGGRAMCGYVTVGCQFCSLKRGECNLQEGTKSAEANGHQQSDEGLSFSELIGGES